MPIAYSYKRFSSDAQEGNDSIRRQTAAAQKFIDDHPEYGLVLDKGLRLIDAGVSAFTGKNIKSGALRLFIDAVRDGTIPAGSWLLIESFDRFTRLPVNEAAEELLGLINRGIIVVTLFDQRIFQQEDYKGFEGMAKLFGALIAMQGHYTEQVTKGRRVAEAWKANYSKIGTTGGRHIVTRIIPFWLKIDSETNSFQVIEERANVVREIFQRRANGEGKAKIAHDLTVRMIPTSKGRSEIWHPSAIQKLLCSDSVIGTLVNNKGERFEHYYPRVVDEEVFQAVNALRKQAPAMGSTAKAHPLTGLVKHDCGTTMRRIDKGANSGSKPKLQCPKCRIGLPFKIALDLVASALSMSQHTPSKTPHGVEIHGLDNVISNLADEVEDARTLWRKTKTIEARQKWERLSEEITALKEELRQLRSSNTEVLQAIEEQAIERAIKAGSSTHSIRSVIRSAHFDISCNRLTVETISSKEITVERDDTSLPAL